MCLAVNYCNSFLLSSSGSTFGWFMAYLLPEKTPVFFNNKVSRSEDDRYRHKEDQFPSEWISIHLYIENRVHEGECITFIYGG